MTNKRRVASCLILCFLFVPLVRAQRLDDATRARIRKEGMENSQIMKTMHMLADVYGPRLTGSPNHKRAAEWTIKQMQEWGLQNGHLEPWNFNHPGWLNERLTAHILSPVKDALVVEALAWTPGTRGVARGNAHLLITPERPTAEVLAAALEKEKLNVRGRIVLVGKPRFVPVNLNPPAKRTDDKEIERRFNPDARPSPSPSPSPSPDPKLLTARQVDRQVDTFLKANRALVRVNDAAREHGQIRAFNNRTFDVTKTVPTVVMRNEDYGRISRLLADGPVTLGEERGRVVVRVRLDVLWQGEHHSAGVHGIDQDPHRRRQRGQQLLGASDAVEET